MSSSYTTEPPPTASVLLHTTAGPIPLSLFATQTPLTCRNFLQLCLDGFYDGVLFHRVVPGFLVQSGDPSGTGSGGQENIYELGERGDDVLDGRWARLLGREVGERIVLGDELHGRLRFGRRGLVGMAKGEGPAGGGGYGSQFFITLGDARAELDGKCTMFGRVEGEGIYNVVKIAEGELSGERPVFPERILRVEVTQMPAGEAWEAIRKRVRVEARVVEESRRKDKVGGGGGKKKAKKGLLSFADEEGEGDVIVKPRKAKFNTALIASDGMDVEEKPTPRINGHTQPEQPADGPPPAKRRKPSVSPPRREKLLASMTARSSPPSKSPDAPPRRKPSFHEPTTQLPLRNEEIPSRSETSSPLPHPSVSTTAASPSKSKSKSSLESEIAALKASMRRDTAPAPAKKKLSALEAMIPVTSTRGRKRPRPGEMGQREDKHALEMLNAFKARLDSVRDVDVDMDADANGDFDRDKGKSKDSSSSMITESKRLNGLTITSPDATKADEPKDNADEDDEETPLCDLHFIANCQSCSKWDSDLHLHQLDDTNPDPSSSSFSNNDNQDTEDKDWMSHRLAFGRDQLGKDLNFKKRREALEELVVIDPREKAGQILAAERERQRVRKEEMKKMGRR